VVFLDGAPDERRQRGVLSVGEVNRRHGPADVVQSAVARDTSSVHPIDERYADQDHQGRQQIPVVQALLV
jgi:hypothetical protein